NPDVDALNADWLKYEVEYLCAQEVFNDINRDEDVHRSQKTRTFLRKFEVLSFKPDKRDQIAEELKGILPGDTENDESDRKQVAETIASGIPYFITSDQGILDQSEVLYEKYSIEIVRPVEFVLLIDELSNSFDYRSFRLA